MVTEMEHGPFLCTTTGSNLHMACMTSMASITNNISTTDSSLNMACLANMASITNNISRGPLGWGSPLREHGRGTVVVVPLGAMVEKEVLGLPQGRQQLLLCQYHRQHLRRFHMRGRDAMKGRATRETGGVSNICVTCLEQFTRPHTMHRITDLRTRLQRG